jgi:hypothetical protein
MALGKSYLSQGGLARELRMLPDPACKNASADPECGERRMTPGGTFPGDFLGC